MKTTNKNKPSKRDKKKFLKLRRKVTRHLNLKTLEGYCTASTECLMGLGEVRESHPDAPKHSFIDRGGDILAVGHLDTIQQGTHFQTANLSGDIRIFNPRLDDRLGVYTICNLLPKLGIKVDVLLTDDEEIGKSTAKDFEEQRQYNWMVEFDRKGSDAVLYNYKEMGALVGEFFEIGNGLFSDISELEHLGCGGFNVGVAYHKYHDNHAYFILNDYIDQVVRFMLFHERYKNVFIHHTPSPSIWDGHSGDGDMWENWEWIPEKGYINFCKECQLEIYPPEISTEDYLGFPLCPYCDSPLMTIALNSVHVDDATGLCYREDEDEDDAGEIFLS